MSNQTANSVSHNRFSPFQTLDEEEIDQDENIEDTEVITHKSKIPPITILKCKMQEIQEICNKSKIKEYSLRKMSIGIKLFCSTKESHELMCNTLTGKYEFFTFATKEEKPFKVVLMGLDTLDTETLKSKLIALGLKCLDVKIVQRKTQYSTYVIYIVYLQRKTITLKELREKFDIIDYIKVKWDYKINKKNNITQCYNCQMFGHGSNRCRVKTFCSNCAGNHLTNECNIDNVIKCANCNGNHKSTDINCPSKAQYISLKQRSQRFRHKQNKNFVLNNNDFPNSLNQNPQSQSVWTQNPNDVSSSSSNLFTAAELQNLTLDLIKNLRNCRCKLDQFEVITNLAVKFLG